MVYITVNFMHLHFTFKSSLREESEYCSPGGKPGRFSKPDLAGACLPGTDSQG